jgi:hypothetical protein
MAAATTAGHVDRMASDPVREDRRIARWVVSKHDQSRIVMEADKNANGKVAPEPG